MRPGLSAAITALLAMAVAGVIAGFAWVLFAEPARWEYTEQGLVLTETAAARQFGVVAWFVGIGAAVSVVAGVIVERIRRLAGWRSVLVVVVGTLVAGCLCARVGLVFGPADPGQAAGLAIGDEVPMRLRVGSFSPVLAWVIGGLVGLGVSTYLRRPAPVSAGDGRDDG